MFTERKAIKERMEQIKEEISELRKERDMLFMRLKELDNKSMEAYDISEVMENLSEITLNLSKLIPKIPLNTVIEEYKKEVLSKVSHEIRIEENTYEESNITEKMVLEEKELDELSAPVRKRKSNDLNIVSSHVASILKEKGRPVRVGELEEELKEKYNIFWNSTVAFNQALINIMKNDDRIERASRGFYQYRF